MRLGGDEDSPQPLNSSALGKKDAVSLADADSRRAELEVKPQHAMAGMRQPCPMSCAGDLPFPRRLIYVYSILPFGLDVYVFLV
jgi:hypothetical protein